MGQILRVRTDLGQHLQTVTLGEPPNARRFMLRLTWRPRLDAWYADLYAADGVAIWEGQRLGAQWGPGAGLRPVGRPEGSLLIRGPDVFERQDLGVGVQIVFYRTEELPDPEPSIYPVAATIA